MIVASTPESHRTQQKLRNGQIHTLTCCECIPTNNYQEDNFSSDAHAEEDALFSSDAQPFHDEIIITPGLIVILSKSIMFVSSVELPTQT